MPLSPWLSVALPAEAPPLRVVVRLPEKRKRKARARAANKRARRSRRKK